MGFDPPLQDDDTNSSQPIDLSNEPPISDEDTNPSASQVMRAVNLGDEPPIREQDSRYTPSIDLSDEPPISDEDTNPSTSQVMRAVNLGDEPPFGPDDTSPSLAFRPSAQAPIPDWRRVVGVVSLLLAAALTVGAVVLLLVPPEAAPAPEAVQTEADSVAMEPTPTEPPTQAAPTDAAVVATAQVADTVAALPTLSAERAAAILAEPLGTSADSGIRVVRNPYDPFTLIPDRPRGEVIGYVVESGDTIGSIAEKFGLRQESIAWANDRNIINILPVGRTVNIPPVDGVLIPHHTGNATIAEYAARYRISDPFDIIDSEYNPELRDLTPNDIPPSGVQVMIPGGQAEQINWNPTVVREGSGGNSSGNDSGGFITFAPNDPGSCGRVPNPGGSGGWAGPIANYTWMRGFTSFHTGIDLAASVGTPVRAAQGGTVIFAGWNNWGYGYTVVLAHGPFTTLYGHLSNINVGCGQSVGAGQVVAGSGNSGNSSGPHLHFEIRFNDQPQDPTQYLGF